jgi:hypothetical protein
VSINLIHPGIVKTAVTRNATLWVRTFMGAARAVTGVSTAQAAANAVALLSSLNPGDPSGLMFSDPRRFDVRQALAGDPESAAQLWDVTEKMYAGHL